MSDSQYEVVLAVFEDEEVAATAYKDLHKADKEHKVDLTNVALIHKHVDGKIEIKEAAENYREAGIGALVGGALGILAGPVGVVTFSALGAAIGGLSARLDDVGFDDTRLKMLGETLDPGKSAILAVLTTEYKERLLSEFEKRGAQVAVEDLPGGFEEILEEGGRFAYRMAVDEAQEAAVELGLIDPEVKDYVGDGEDSPSDPSSEEDPNAAIPKF